MFRGSVPIVILNGTVNGKYSNVPGPRFTSSGASADGDGAYGESTGELAVAVTFVSIEDSRFDPLPVVFLNPNGHPPARTIGSRPLGVPIALRFGDGAANPIPCWSNEVSEQSVQVLCMCRKMFVCAIAVGIRRDAIFTT